MTLILFFSWAVLKYYYVLGADYFVLKIFSEIICLNYEIDIILINFIKVQRYNT